MVNAIFAKREFFLRELILSASDALAKKRCDKIELTEFEAQPELAIRIIPAADNTLTIEDSGIGTTKKERFLGSFGRSSSIDFYESRQACLSLFGRYGIGLVFRVEERVRVISQTHHDEQFIWEAQVQGPFTVRKDTEMLHGKIKRGTKVICVLIPVMSEVLEIRRLKDLAKKLSIGFPITFGSSVCGERSGERSVLLMTFRWMIDVCHRGEQSKRSHFGAESRDECDDDAIEVIA